MEFLTVIEVAYEFKLPDLGEGITSGEIKRWRVKKGEKIEEDQTVAEVETDKAVVELPSSVTGVIADLYVPEGAKAGVAQTVATIAVEGAPAKVAPPVQAKAVVQVTAAEKPGVAAPRGEKKGVPLLATPATRMLAKQLDFDLAAVKGTGPGGRITGEDVPRVVNGAEGQRFLDDPKRYLEEPDLLLASVK